MDIPVLKVGIMAREEILFTLRGEYLTDDLSLIISGPCKAVRSSAGIYFESGDHHLNFRDNLNLVPVVEKTGSFSIHLVTIGIDFHWERQEDQVFKGALSFITDGDKIQAINLVSIEDYLLSVISSEMSATASLDFLKAHAVISRSWLLAQVQKNQKLQNENLGYQNTFRSEDELITWYDREDHQNFDVCADDHCQRYQGITRATTAVSELAVHETHGEVLVFKGLICDARFSKCCGGLTELFENVWEPVSHPYLKVIVDNSLQPELIPDLSNENTFANWMHSTPDVFCNTSDPKVLSQVLNDYDQETNDFFRWKVTYSQKELSDLIKFRTGIDFGLIADLIPVKRGASGRLIELKIVGSSRSMIIGKELEIRKTLSKTHLYSSAFIVEIRECAGQKEFILHGSGWGHGVGLCQIGAAVMGEKGYPYREILAHYFTGAKVERRYTI